MTSLTSIFSQHLMLELAAREQRTALFRKSCARRVTARARFFNESLDDAYEQEMLSRVGVKSTAGVYER
jgi:hypothetical protein